MNKKMNDKGFSLVELIVVIAIMGILAVTLAPRLTQYIGRARTESDREAVSAIYTAAKLANAEFPLGASYSDYSLGTAAAANNGMFITDGESWNLNETTVAGTVYTPPTDDEDFFNTLKEALSNFKLKSTFAGDNTRILISTDEDGNIIVKLNYDNDESGTATDLVDTYTLGE